MIDKLVIRELLHRVKMVVGSYPTEFNIAKHTCTTKCTDYYEDAVRTLNLLQTNASVLQDMKKRNRTHSAQYKNIEETTKYLTRSGVSLEKLDGLSVIHVSGTKGKGSTCAFCESILRHHGYKTGFYSSPHLVAVRERIRINGQPLSQHDFTRHFWKTYNRLSTFKETDRDMPPYFKFLTVMAFNVFLAEKVDVAIIEVGIGGEYDCTNILRKVSTVGITSLGLDHTSLLGNTIEQIAWQKAGIMKPGSVAITVEQPKAALRILKERASEKKSTLLLAPPLQSYDWGCFTPELDALPDVQLLNASLALQLTHTWMQHNRNGFTKSADIRDIIPKKEKSYEEERIMQVPVASTFEVTSSIAAGLKLCTWPGRNQIISEGQTHYFLDGAHTKESLEMCAHWFRLNSQTTAKQDIPLRVLVFNCTGARDSKTLLTPLLNCDFQLVIFCPNNITTSVDSTSDQANFTVSTTQQFERCKKNEEAWCELDGAKPIKARAEVMFFPCVSDSLNYLQKRSVDESMECHVCVTGSLHLVGSVLSVLDPDLKLAQSQLHGAAGTDSENFIQTYNS